jgi:hypothetical protein
VAGRVQARASRSLTWIGVVFGTALGSLIPLSFPFLDLTYVQATDPPVILPVTIWPLAPVKLAVGLLFGPVAGLVTGLASQVATLALSGFDLTTTWTWVLAGGLCGWIAGWLPRRLPATVRPTGSRRYIGASITGLVAAALGFLPVLLDPLLRTEVTWPFALGEYLTIVVPTAILAALTLPLVLAVGLKLQLHPAIHASDPVPPARPTWRPFALVYVLAFAVLLTPLYLPSSVRALGQVSAAGGPAAAPAPGASGVRVRSIALSIGTPPAVDRSCEAESGLHSPPTWAAVDVTLYNDTDLALGVSWLDYTGHRDQRQEIEAGDPLIGHWSANHPFVLTGPDGACLMIFKVLGTAPINIHLSS